MTCQAAFWLVLQMSYKQKSHGRGLFKVISDATKTLKMCDGRENIYIYRLHRSNTDVITAHIHSFDNSSQQDGFIIIQYIQVV